MLLLVLMMDFLLRLGLLLLFLLGKISAESDTLLRIH
jgi:hypothetical protein